MANFRKISIFQAKIVYLQLFLGKLFYLFFKCAQRRHYSKFSNEEDTAVAEYDFDYYYYCFCYCCCCFCCCCCCCGGGGGCGGGCVVAGCGDDDDGYDDDDGDDDDDYDVLLTMFVSCRGVDRRRVPCRLATSLVSSIF